MLSDYKMILWHFDDATDLEAILNECPAADVQEVKHGRWVKGKEWFECSVCGYEQGSAHWHYCPNCGSRMDELIDIAVKRIVEHQASVDNGGKQATEFMGKPYICNGGEALNCGAKMDEVTE